MAQLKKYTSRILKQYLSSRPGETKLGENITFLDPHKEVKDSKASFVLLGVPEDIGVRANYAKAGTAAAWNETLRSFLNIQENQFISGQDLLLLGEIDCSREMEVAANLEPTDPNFFIKLGELVEEIDRTLGQVVREVVAAGKRPIVIGGGHNNAYGMLKGTSDALHQRINVLNIDAHTDLRRLEHRHSGNGFSYAFNDGAVNSYGVFGLHQNYTPQYIFDQISQSSDKQFVLFEELNDLNRFTAFLEMLDDIGTRPFGLEIDCDVIAGFPSSAQSPTGFTLNAVREMVRAAAQKDQCKYLHLCEAIPTEQFPAGKALSYLISDFIKAGYPNQNK